jgi:glutamate transport system substrate-binding protein
MTVPHGRNRRLLAGVLVLSAFLSACSSGEEATDKPPAVRPGSLYARDTLRIAVKIDQPGIGEIVDGNPHNRRGLDIDVAKYVAQGLKAGHIQWFDAISKYRETMIENNEVDLVIASYGITEARRDRIAFAGPYFEIGQDILVRTADAKTITTLENLKDRKTCSATGSTSAQRLVQRFGAPWDTPRHLLKLDGYSECVSRLMAGEVDAVSTDNAILAGYAAKFPGQLHLVDSPFSREEYGIGISKENGQEVGRINAILREMIKDGSWAASVHSNLGEAARPFLKKVPSP